MMISVASIDDYIKSEKFIWDDLIARGEKAVQRVREAWSKGRFFERTLYAWPSEHIQTESGVITHIISFEVPDNMSTHEAALNLAKASKAYALLLIEPRQECVKIILESHHGARAWTLPVQRHGDIDVLKKEEVTTDTENIGILWRPLTVRA